MFQPIKSNPECPDSRFYIRHRMVDTKMDIIFAWIALKEHDHVNVADPVTNKQVYGRTHAVKVARKSKQKVKKRRYNHQRRPKQ